MSSHRVRQDCGMQAGESAGQARPCYRATRPWQMLQPLLKRGRNSDQGPAIGENRGGLRGSRLRSRPVAPTRSKRQSVHRQALLRRQHGGGNADVTFCTRHGPALVIDSRCGWRCRGAAGEHSDQHRGRKRSPRGALPDPQARLDQHWLGARLIGPPRRLRVSSDRPQGPLSFAPD